MAVSTSSRFGSGVSVGVPQVAVDFDKFASHATPRFRVGYKVEDADGNIYRYSHFGDDVNRGVLVAQDVSETSLGDSDNVIVASASCSVTTDGLAGSKFFEVTAGDPANAVTLNQFAGGKFITSDDSGEGYTYDVIGNTANAVSGTSIRIQLKQKLQVAVTATTDFILVGNKYNNLEIATNGTDCIVAGVSCKNMDVSEEAWGWVQSKGVVGILSTNAGSEVIGEKITLSTGTSGAVSCGSNIAEASVTVDQVLGSVLVAGDSTGHGAYYINVD